MKRITITIEESLYDKLPKYGKSGVINLLIKQHYQKEGLDQLYESIKKRLVKDGLLTKEQLETRPTCLHGYIVGECTRPDAKARGCNALY